MIMALVKFNLKKKENIVRVKLYCYDVLKVLMLCIQNDPVVNVWKKYD